MSDKLEAGLQELVKTVEGRMGELAKAVEAEATARKSEVQEFDKKFLDAVGELRSKFDEAVKATGGTVTTALADVEKRLTEMEKRAGRPKAPSETNAPIEKTAGKLFVEELQKNNDYFQNAKLVGNKVRSGPVVPIPSELFPAQRRAIGLLKANGLLATDENIRKAAVALSDATNFAPVSRQPDLPFLPKRRIVMRDLIPSRPINVGSFEYLEYQGSGADSAASMTSITSSTITATATTAAAHSLKIGDVVQIIGADEAGYNGVHRVLTVPSTTTFTYYVPAATADTTTGTITWRNLTHYGAGAAVAEAAVKPLATWHPVLRTGTVQVIAHYIKVTRQALDDVVGLESTLNMSLGRGLEEAVEDELLSGSGVSPHLPGIFNNVQIGSYTQATAGSVGRLSAYRHALTMIELNGGMANGMVVNPLDWESAELSVGLDDHFLFTDGMGQFGQAPSLWRVPVVVSKSVAPLTVLVGAFDEGAIIFDRQAASIQMADQNDTDFLYNLLAIRAELRLGFAVTRPELFVNLTML